MLLVPRVAASASSFRNMVRPELQFPNVSSPVASLIAQPSDCVPAGAVLLSTTNAYHARLRVLQFARVAPQACLMRRVLSVCFNVSDGFGECVPGPSVNPAEFRKSNYANLIWAKRGARVHGGRDRMKSRLRPEGSGLQARVGVCIAWRRRRALRRSQDALPRSLSGGGSWPTA